MLHLFKDKITAKDLQLNTYFLLLEQIQVCLHIQNDNMLHLLKIQNINKIYRLTLVALWVYSTRRFVLCLTLCYFVIVFFSPFSIAITLLGEEKANLSAFRMFVRFVLVWFFRIPLPLGVWEGLRFAIVALTGLSLTYFFFFFFFFFFLQLNNNFSIIGQILAYLHI